MEQAIRTILTLTSVAITVGCDESRRLAEQAARNTEMQASQNHEMARVNREVAEGSRRLVAADAEARRQVLAIQKDLQTERQQIAVGRDALEAERQQMAAQRHRDPVVAAAITNTGIILACLLPLALCGYLLHSLCGRSSEEAIGDVLLMDLVSESPLLLPPAQRQDQPRLPAPVMEATMDDDPPPF
jgi:hypothetical protein